MRKIVLFILAVVVGVAVAAGAGAPQDSKLKNIKVLTGMSDADVNKEMQTWTKALGVKCSHCHKLGDFASDENPTKATARKMATMVKTINKDFFNGEAKANCMTCHRGAAIPTLEGN